MVNLFSFGCHVIDRAYVRKYVHTEASTDCKGGVGETIKREGGVSQACLDKPHLVYWTFTITGFQCHAIQNRSKSKSKPCNR